MQRMLYSPLERDFPVQLRELTDAQMAEIPLVRQVLHLMTLLSEGELKLTAKGYLPPKVVEALYEMGSHSWSTDWYKQKSEPKVEEVRVLRVVLKECGLVKVRTGKMSLTAKGKRLLAERNDLIHTVMLFLLRDYNTGWLDGYDDMETGNVGRLYSLWLLHHFGEEWRLKEFYAGEYFRAFPTLKNANAYGFRVFNRLFRLIGLCDVNDREDDYGPGWGHKVIKTGAVDLMFEFDEPA